MHDDPANDSPWRQSVLVFRRAWQPLLLAELLISLLGTFVLGPLLLACAYQWIGIDDEQAWTNGELVWFLLSARGALTLVMSVAIALGLVLLEYAVLILLADAALRKRDLALGQVTLATLAAAPRLFGLALLGTCVAIVVALPFLGFAALVYWVLLSGTDINFYLTERPPRFWIAVLLGMVTAVALVVALLWLLARWALAVPACIVERQSWWAALQSSQRRMRGRGRRLLALLVAWQLLNIIVLAVAILALDQLHGLLLASLQERLTTLVGTTVALLLLDTAVLQCLSALFAIGMAVLIAHEYLRASQSEPDAQSNSAPSGRAVGSARRSAWQAGVAIVALLLLGPVASMAYAWNWAQQLVEHRPARVTAHRAGPKAAPENSLAALRLALEAGADVVEIDVQQSADGQVVLLHDRDLRRVTGDPRDLSQLTLAELQTLRLRLGSESTDERIPTLVEFLAACGDRMRLNVELKETSRYPHLATEVVRVLHEQGFSQRAAVSCFDLPPLLAARQADPGLPIGMILSAVKGDMTRLPVNFLSLNHRLVQADVVRRAHARAMEVHAWTVNDRGTALRLLDLGCDNLITSDPALMREVVDWYADLSDAERMVLRLRRWLRR